jgi:predicted nucleotidyltransferase
MRPRPSCARGITHLSLFGSLARGEAGAHSDVDVLIDLALDAPFGLFDLIDLIDLQDQLAERFGRPVNVAFQSTLRAWLRERIESDRIEIF